jgi:hypothetical protein
MGARRGRGLAATAVAWGVWDVLEETDPLRDEVAERSGAQGVPLLDVGRGLKALRGVLDEGAAAAVLADVRWDRFAPLFTSGRPSPLLADLPDAQRAQRPLHRETSEATANALRDRLVGLPETEQERVLVELVRAQVAGVLRYDGPHEVDPTRAFSDLGFESVTAVELRNRLSAATGVPLPATLVFDHPTPAAMAGWLRAELLTDGIDGLTALLAHLDTVESGMAGLSDADRAAVTARLRSLLAAPQGADSEESVTDRLQSASDDEIFAFIRTELGRP